MPIDYAAARALLDERLSDVEARVLAGTALQPLPAETGAALQQVFESNTQAFREVLLGCTVARLLDREVNIRLPYVKLAPDAFNGRTLDERCINPFLHDNRLPSSKGPYLSVFRRSVTLDESTKTGIRDKAAYVAFLACISTLESADEDAEIRLFLDHLLEHFVALREASQVPLTRIQRLSLEQYEKLIARLASTASGGRFPLFLVVATFQTIKSFCKTDWQIDWQGINVADAPSGAGGDVTVSEQGKTLLAVEITERNVDRARIVSTFNTKIGPAGIEDYLFITTQAAAGDEARDLCRQYFSQGHEINFVELKTWIMMILATVTSTGRQAFNRSLVELIGRDEVPTSLKVVWNDALSSLVLE